MTAQSTTISVLAHAKKIVAKVGSSLVTNDGQGIDREAVAHWAQQIAALRSQDKLVVLVSSGAIAEGMARLGWSKRPTSMHELQAAAAVGQMGLAQAYEQAFAAHQLRTAQILLTHEDLADRQRYLNARSTLLALLRLGVVPIVNENDTVATDEIAVGDNDTLGALVTNLIDADALVILTDQKGLYEADPRKDPQARFVSHGKAGDPSLEVMAGGSGSGIGKGGMLTKILAAKRAARSGAHTIIASGREENVMVRLASGESIGSELRADTPVLSARKQWMADHLRLRGRLVLDPGAVNALKGDGKSLLPVGVRNIEGEFEPGDVVACVDSQGKECARGLTNYSSADARRIMGQPSNKIEEILGQIGEPELIHRDNLITL
ncbi:glutamate 5-kinase [Orrella sp. NBD-18]|uniref:Glutamate 5-kinase n=1 Tax=Sheuella amnicola TaxID=2707330 RepID=A0A6B2R451_9BURK|nr:glutamate 5-kinase [Sheuella amnicola]NDY82215.1 glutamate 5-kinase [Sheuella amnicola]HBI83298.1 glutamate 5-kinase [Alcaligenaceae bacterium]